MIRAFGRNTLLIGALMAGAGLTGALATWMTTPSGAQGPLVFGAQSVFAAGAAVVLAFTIATAAGIVVGRVTNAAVGMFVVGGALYGLAWRTGTVEVLIHDGRSFLTAAAETLVCAGLLLASTMAVFRFVGPLPDVEPDEDGNRPHPFFSADALKAIGAGVIALPLIWVVAQTFLKGQVIGAAFVASMVAALAGRMLVPHLQPMVVFVAPVVFAAVGQVIAAITLGSTPMRAALVADTLPHLGYPMPLDLAAGCAMGAAFGLGWAKSFLHHEHHEHPAVRGA